MVVPVQTGPHERLTGSDAPAGAAEPSHAASGNGSVLHSLLKIPLFFKLFLANSAIVVGVTAIGGFFAARTSVGESLQHPMTIFLMIAAAGMVLSLLANAAIVWVALTPIRSLEQTAARLRAGDHTARATTSPLADRDLERLATTFNEVLDAVADRTRRLRETAARALSATEEERRRLARELHDGIAQSLAALNIRVKLARNAADHQLRTSDLDEVSGGIADAILELRRMARGLRPPALEMLGLAAAIESHAKSVVDAAGLDVSISTNNVTGLLSPDTELAVYRILQESLSNVVRHAGAAHVTVDLARNDGKVVLTIEDDGRGFDIPAVRGNDRGLGLFGMEERAAFIGGRIEFESNAGKGTRVQLAVPVLEGEIHGG